MQQLIHLKSRDYNIIQDEDEDKDKIKQSTNKLAKIKLVGITVHTSNAQERDPDKAQIGEAVIFFSSDMQMLIHERKNPNRVFAVYINYESDKDGEYTFFIGLEVNEFAKIDHPLEAITIPPNLCKVHFRKWLYAFSCH